MKTLLASSCLVFVSAGAAIAGPYAVVENNSSYLGSDSLGGTTDFHIGYETSFDDVSVFGEIGPTLVSPDNGEVESIITAKAGASAQLTDKLVAYGELSVAFDEEENGYGTKIGVKYSF